MNNHSNFKGIELYNQGMKYWGINDEIKQDKEKALQLFKKAAQVYGNKDALYSLGQVYEFGEMKIYRNVQKAIYYYLLSSEKGNMLAYYRLGQIFEKGLGVPIDKDKAIYYYQKSGITINDQFTLNSQFIIQEPNQQEQQPEKESAIFRKTLMTDTYSESDHVQKEVKNKESQQQLCGNLCTIF